MNSKSVGILFCLIFALGVSAGAEGGEAVLTRGDEITVISFESLPGNIALIGGAITLDSNVQANGDITSTGSICDSNGCIGGGGGPMQAFLSFDLPSTFGGGTALVNETWVTRNVNMEIYDTANIVTLSANQFTLGAGTYQVTANQVFFADDSQIRSFRGRIRNVTDNTTVALSLSGRFDAPAGTSANAESSIPPMVFTIADTKTFELQYWIEASSSDNDALGFPVSSGDDERYAWIHLKKF